MVIRTGVGKSGAGLSPLLHWAGLRLEAHPLPLVPLSLSWGSCPSSPSKTSSVNISLK